MHVEATGNQDDFSQNPDLLPDSDLVHLLKQRDQNAFGIFFKRYSRLVNGIAMGILRDAAEAEDTTQNVFWDIYRAIERYDGTKGTLRTWLLQYAYHRAFNQKKSLESHRIHQMVQVEEADVLQSTRPKLHTIETAQAVRQALGFLTSDQQTTLRMLFFEGVEMQDVAQKLGQQVSNVRHHYYRGLRKLRDIMNGDDPRNGEEDRPSSPSEGRRQAISHAPQTN